MARRSGHCLLSDDDKFTIKLHSLPSKFLSFSTLVPSACSRPHGNPLGVVVYSLAITISLCTRTLLLFPLPLYLSPSYFPSLSYLPFTHFSSLSCLSSSYFPSLSYSLMEATIPRLFSTRAALIVVAVPVVRMPSWTLGARNSWDKIDDYDVPTTGKRTNGYLLSLFHTPPSLLYSLICNFQGDSSCLLLLGSRVEEWRKRGIWSPSSPMVFRQS